jgi:aspartate ammonia-lyase
VTTVPTRTAEDALGPVLVPADAYYGAQTQRATEHFDISGVVLGDFPGYLAAIAEVKKAAALANADVGVLRPEVAVAIARAADELVAGTSDRSQDLRVLASGNRSGLGEITLPAVQAGSSLLPGKINPVMPELMIQIG